MLPSEQAHGAQIPLPSEQRPEGWQQSAMGPQTLPSPPWDQGEDAVRLLQKHTKMLILRLPSDQVGQASAPLKTAAQVWLTFQDALHRVPQSSFAGLCFQNFPGLWDSPVKEVAL